MSRSIAIIAWYFPPIGGAGSQRPLHFARGLSSLGNSVRVLTPARPPSSIWSPEDHDLEELSIGLDVRRLPNADSIGSSEADRTFSKCVLSELGNDRPETVVITMSPFALAELTSPIRELGVKVVLDLRDPWALDAWPGYRSWWNWKKNFDRMRLRLGEADGIIVNTQDACREIRRAIPELSQKPLVAIENGWYEGDFSSPWRPQNTIGIGRDNPLRVVHSGTLHAGRPQAGFFSRRRLRDLVAYAPQKIEKTGRGPGYLLAAVKELVSEGYDIECDFFGVGSPEMEAVIDAYELGDRVSMSGYVPHGAVVEKIRDAGALFLPLGGLPTGERSLIVPGKTYEYLAAGPPVIAALPEGDARDLVGQSNRGFLADPCNVSSIRSSIERCMQWWNDEDVPRRGMIEPFMDRYERGAQAVRLLDFIESLPSC